MTLRHSEDRRAFGPVFQRQRPFGLQRHVVVQRALNIAFPHFPGQLVQQLYRITLPVLLTTGYVDTLERGQSDAQLQVLAKPFRPSDLGKRIRQILNKS